MQTKPIEKQKTAIWSTKLTKSQLDDLDRITKEIFHLRTPYELMQYIAGVLISLDKICHGVSVEREEMINTFLTPFIEISEKSEFLKSYKKSIGIDGNVGKKHGNIEKAIIIRQGGFVEIYSKDENEQMQIDYSRDDAALEVFTAGKPRFREVIEKIMEINKCKSFIECTRLLYKDALQDAIIAERISDPLGYVSNEYGNVPKKTHVIKPKEI